MRGEIQNLMINIPPQHGKSEIVKTGISWNYGINPNDRIVYSSYGYSLAGKANRHIQRLIDSREYKEIFPQTYLNDRSVRVDASSNYLKNTDEFEIVGHTGSFISVGVGGGLTGNPVDKAIIDDPIKDRMAAESVTIRENVWDWYVNVLSSRLHNKSQKLFIMTRWHEDDPAGRIISLVEKGDLNEKWDIIRIPGIKNEIENEGDNRKEGEALWEEQHNLKKLLDFKRLDPYAFECLYQQNPQPKEGLLFSQFKTYTKIPNGVVRNITDPADSGECYTCSICYIEFMKQIYVVDILYNQEKDMEKNIAEMLYKNNVGVAEIESNSMGRLFRENVKRILFKEFRSNRTNVIGFNQRDNKDAKIFTSASWINENIIMPENWAVKYYQFHNHIRNYPVSGKTKFKDGADVLAEIFKRTNKSSQSIVYG